jgi:YD repeat-containing protein
VHSRRNTDGNRTRITHPDGNYFRTDRDGLDRPTFVWANASTTIGYYYNAQGALWEMDRTNGTATQYYHDGVQRLSFMVHDLAGSPADASWTLNRNAAGQITSLIRNNDSYAWIGHYAVNRGYTTNGLNQYTAAGSASFGYDARGNLTSDGSRTFVYDVENRLVSSSSGAALSYDPLGRLFQVTAPNGAVTRFLYDPGSGSRAGGDALVAEYDGSNTLLRRHVHWQSEGDHPVATFEVTGGTGLGTLRTLFADQQGSIVAIADGNGAVTQINRYDELLQGPHLLPDAGPVPPDRSGGV